MNNMLKPSIQCVKRECNIKYHKEGELNVSYKRMYCLLFKGVSAAGANEWTVKIYLNQIKTIFEVESMTHDHDSLMFILGVIFLLVIRCLKRRMKKKRRLQKTSHAKETFLDRALEGIFSFLIE